MRSSVGWMRRVPRATAVSAHYLRNSKLLMPAMEIRSVHTFSAEDVAPPGSKANADLTTHHQKCVGAHISASGGCLKALDNAQQLLGPHARSFAFFIRPRLSWKRVPPIDDAQARAFRQRIEQQTQFNTSNIVVHGSYIVNFGSHDVDLRRKSVELMVEEVEKCAQLGIRNYVFHPGSCTRVPERLDWTALTKKKTRAATIPRSQLEEARAREAEARALSVQYIAECMAQVLHETTDVTLCVENMCGQGNVLGRDFDELRAILDGVVACGSGSGSSSSALPRDRLGVCLDTCHAHSSGMAMQTAEQCEQMMRNFYEIMGDAWRTQRVLKVIHVNDSMDVCGSRKDRHENIGLGRIGLPAFEWLMNSPHFDGLPIILETPRRGQDAIRERVQKIDDAAQQELLESVLVQDTDANEIEVLMRLVH